MANNVAVNHDSVFIFPCLPENYTYDFNAGANVGPSPFKNSFIVENVNTEQQLREW